MRKLHPRARPRTRRIICGLAREERNVGHTVYVAIRAGLNRTSDSWFDTLL